MDGKVIDILERRNHELMFKSKEIIQDLQIKVTIENPIFLICEKAMRVVS